MSNVFFHDLFIFKWSLWSGSLLLRQPGTYHRNGGLDWVKVWAVTGPLLKVDFLFKAILWYIYVYV